MKRDLQWVAAMHDEACDGAQGRATVVVDTLSIVVLVSFDLVSCLKRVCTLENCVTVNWFGLIYVVGDNTVVSSQSARSCVNGEKLRQWKLEEAMADRTKGDECYVLIFLHFIQITYNHPCLTINLNSLNPKTKRIKYGFQILNLDWVG